MELAELGVGRLGHERGRSEGRTSDVVEGAASRSRERIELVGLELVEECEAEVADALAVPLPGRELLLDARDGLHGGLELRRRRDADR